MWPERVVGPLTFIDQPAQMVGAVGRLVDATNVPVPAADDIVPAALVDRGAETGRAELEGHYEYTRRLFRPHLTLAPLLI